MSPIPGRIIVNARFEDRKEWQMRWPPKLVHVALDGVDQGTTPSHNHSFFLSNRQYHWDVPASCFSYFILFVSSAPSLFVTTFVIPNLKPIAIRFCIRYISPSLPLPFRGLHLAHSLGFSICELRLARPFNQHPSFQSHARLPRYRLSCATA